MLLLVPPTVTVASATVAWGTEPMKLSSTGPSSTLPSFFFMAGGEEGGSLWTSYNYSGGRADPAPYEPETSCPDDVFDNTSPDLHVPKLPWRLQEDWGCEGRGNVPATDVKVVTIETASLRAAVTPQWGGKVWSLFHKGHQKQMFFNNPAHQPGNIGYLKAWSSGGAEWNWSPGYIGHSAFTESPVWTASIPTPLGDVLRVWEYDRLNSTTWQVDILLVNDTMFAHPKVSNPHPVQLHGYWWTCVAMPVDAPTTRVIANASLSINGGGCAAWPNGGLGSNNASFRGIDKAGCRAADDGRGTCAWQNDLSFLGNIPHSNDFFMHIDPNVEPWIAHAKNDGWTVVHSHPKRLNGTKFFQWGYNEFGQFNTDFLSGADTDVPTCNQDAYDPYCADMVHPGNYTELQVGPARTQMHTFPLPAAAPAPAARLAGREATAEAIEIGAYEATEAAGRQAASKPGTYEWTEWFKAFQADPAVMQSADYSAPVGAVDAWLNSPTGMSAAAVKQADDLLTALADTPPTPAQIISKGMPWGGVQERLQAKLAQLRDPKLSAVDALSRARIAPGCPFPPPEATDETRPWLELLENGTFSTATLAAVPVNFEVSDGWVHLLDASMAAGHETWLHHLFLATHALEVGNAAAGKVHLDKSMALKPNVHASRALALLAPTQDAAASQYMGAWALWIQLSEEKHVPGKAAATYSDPNVHQLGADLSGEIAGWLLGNQRWADLGGFLQKLEAGGAATASFLAKDRVLHAQAALAVSERDFTTAISIIRKNCFPTYGRCATLVLGIGALGIGALRIGAREAPPTASPRLAYIRT